MIVQIYGKLNHIQSLLVALRASHVLIFTKIPDLQAFLTEYKAKGHTVGFVPTMGALHEGHISLIRASAEACSLTLCSIFVNPTQFNNPEDLKRYPRMPEKDAKMLEKAGCEVLFLPSVEEMYPKGGTETFDLGTVSKVLEGAYRPGHFNGVAQVIKRFFEIIKPDKAFFGSKDYQQVLVVRALVKQLDLPVEIISCPIKREPDGLAMSSRNALLSPEERILASNIPPLMQAAVSMAKVDSVSAARQYIKDQLGRFPNLKLDYFEICDAHTLQSIDHTDETKNALALIAVYVGKIRLIDNLFLY